MFVVNYLCECICRYFYGSDDSDDGGGAVSGDVDNEMTRQLIAKEYHQDEGTGKGVGSDEDNDPLDAFMVGIEVIIIDHVTMTSRYYDTRTD